MTGRFRSSVGSSALPRPNSSLRESRVSSYRPERQEDIITGAEIGPKQYNGRPSSRAAESLRASSRESSKENLAPPDAEEYETQRKKIEELKADLATMQYRIKNYEEEKEMALLQYENELREVRRKAEEDFKQRQTAEGAKSKAQRQYESLQNEVNELKENAVLETQALEKKAREFDDEARLVKEQLADLSTAKEETERMNEKRITDLQTQMSNLRKTLEELEKERDARDALLQQVQEQLTAKDKQMGDLETDILRLKAQTGDAETIAVIRRELTDQVQHIRSLESRNAKQHAELSHLRQIHKAVDVVEEEKRSLQRRLEVADSLEAELAEARIQRQRLEDERLAWTAYLQNASAQNGLMEFDSPEAVARALVEERYNSAALVEKLGEIQPQITERDEIIKLLEADKRNLNSEIEKLKLSAAPMPVDKARGRVERQRALAIKEAEFLRAQLKALDDEDVTFEPDKVDQQKADRIKELEKLLEKYKAEVDTLHKDLSAVESSKPNGTQTNGLAQSTVGSKRSHEEELESEQIGELNRKRRKLADELSKEKTAHQLLQKEFSVVRSRLEASEAQRRTRILSLRSNPTSDFEATKVSTLKALKEENSQLLSQLQRASPKPSFPVIPASQLDACRREVEEAKKETASAQKTTRRLKEVWASKSQEFKEAIFSTLGWTVTFIPNGKMRVESLFYPSQTEEHENSIVFDGERGTMKVSGGPQSAFARRIGDQIQFWVRDKGCIPGFLASLTLEFYEESLNSKSQ